MLARHTEVKLQNANIKEKSSEISRGGNIILSTKE